MYRSMKAIEGCRLKSKNGEIGKIRDFYLDDRDWAIRYAVADTGTWLPGRLVMLSPQAFGTFDWTERVLPVNLTKEQIESSPGIEKEKPVSRRYEEALNSYYGWQPYWGMGLEPGATPVAAAGAEDAGQDTVKVDPNLRSVKEIRGYTINTKDEENAAHVEGFIVDDDEWKVKYVVADTRNWLPGGKKVIVPLERIAKLDFGRAACVLRMTKGTLEKCPEYDGISPDIGSVRVKGAHNEGS